ncbi:MAG: MbcA/ParS/Xre antitoxin family protein [Syntrophomonadaceae bacterium]|nr:MbcA/ParS/Xre antitoxin family protein [Syntrophomonadaceae bacterium]MDD3889910.1 MbcA/ParS/Xre antitoxin family protein [Syntrophomonadaceae bacterium]MDD4549571.1 MbcA/ParS/Xre antitoxin family protein [Syntrophomonadaceae bacterium]
MADIWFIVIKDQETERWLDTPHPELDDKSPRELMQDEQGCTRLIAMLDEFTKSISTKEEKELIDYMRCRVTG